MPDFLDTFDNGGSIGVIQWADLDQFTSGYIEALFFAPSSDEIDNLGFSDLAPETLQTIIADCLAFQTGNAETLARVYQGDYSPRRAGVDFWFTRNGHGAGFWDRDLGDDGQALTDAAHKVGEIDLYRGDDGKIYLA